MHEVVPMNWALFPAMQRAWSLVAAGLRDETTTDAQSRAREEPSIVAALCICVLGEHEGRVSAAWPPRSVAELRGLSGGLAQNGALLEQGLDALDEMALRETGCCFARLDPQAQLRSLFQLEAGRGRLSRRQVSAFMDAFLTLAAEAYLRDALKSAPAAP